MPEVIILGSSYSIPDEEHENTHMVVACQERTILIDCVGNPILRLKRARVEFTKLTDLILTHFHPDHVAGVPSLLMDMWLMGRRNSLDIYGLHHTLDRIEDLMGFYDWQRWPDFFPVVFHRLPEREMIPVLSSPEVNVFASPVQHLIPTIGLRFEFLQPAKSMAYSCDTEPSQNVVRLARDVDVLVHEATGAGVGHSSPRQAGEIASQANARSLYLIHYPPGADQAEGMLAEARQAFAGRVALAEDFGILDFSAGQ
jgi:ribonuclease Z